jgi:hypothetical protein
MRQLKFSELALAGAKRLVPDESRRQSLIFAIRFYLERDGHYRSRRCPAFPDRPLWIFGLASFRILYEDTDPIFVWSIVPATENDIQ